MNLNSTDARDVRRFGVVCLVFFGFICSAAIWKEKSLAIYFFGTLTLTGLGFTLFPEHFMFLYRAWLKAAMLVNRVLITFLLVLLYYIVVTPSALLKRLFGPAPITSKLEKSTDSYWIARAESLQPRDRYYKRF